jgi:hypothetical protein
MSRVRANRGIELTTDGLFQRRVRRLVAVSAIALGIIFWLAAHDGASWWVLALIGIGWVLMPTFLAASLSKPTMRYLLIIPATTVGVGLIAMTLTTDGANRTGWLLITLGILSGGMFGLWFWYRWFPVPRLFDDPFGWPRLVLLAGHVGLILLGIGVLITAI